MKIKRNINWVSSSNIENEGLIENLSKNLQNFYSNSSSYYEDIDCTENYWNDYKSFKFLGEELKKYESILEIGCGRANILKHFKSLEKSYTGCDFSKKLIEDNSLKFQKAFFETLTDSKKLPFQKNQFDCVFSVFVLEHVCYPSKFLDNITNVLNQNGMLYIICPDYLGKGRVVSQRSGFSTGNFSDKFKRGMFIDSFVTLFDNRIRIPLLTKLFKFKNRKKSNFFINLNPIVFEDKFYPDVDAVYLTDKSEIQSYLSKEFNTVAIPLEVEAEVKKNGWIFLKFQKK